MEGNKIISNLMWKFAERLLAQGVTLVVTLCLARILSPKDYGVVALALIVVSVAEAFATAGLGNSLIQKKNADNVDFSSIFYFNIVFSVLLYTLIFAASPMISYFFSEAVLTKVIRVLAIRIPIAAINTVQQAYVSRNMLFKRFFWSTFFGTIISGVVGILMALNGFGVWAIVAQYLTNALIDTVVLWITVRWRPVKRFSFDRVKTLISYGWKLVVADVLDILFVQLRNVFIGKFYSAEQLAYYTNGNLYPQALTSGINTTISSVLFPALSKEQEDVSIIKEMTRKAVGVSSYVMWPVMLGMAAIAPCFIEVILSSKWNPCVPYIQLACVTYAFWPIHTANLEAVRSIGRSDWVLKLEIIKNILCLMILLISVRISVFAIALGALLTSVICCFINAYPNKKLIDYSFFEQIKDIFPSLVKSLLMALIVWSIGYNEKNAAILIVQILSGMLVYVILSAVLRDRNYMYLLETAKKTVRKK